MQKQKVNPFCSFAYTLLWYIPLEVFVRAIYLVLAFAPWARWNFQQKQQDEPSLKQKYILSWEELLEHRVGLRDGIGVQMRTLPWVLCECTHRGSEDPAACATPAGKKHPARPQGGKQGVPSAWRALHGLCCHSHNYLVPRLRRNHEKSICCQDTVGREKMYF